MINDYLNYINGPSTHAMSEKYMISIDLAIILLATATMWITIACRYNGFIQFNIRGVRSYIIINIKYQKSNVIITAMGYIHSMYSYIHYSENVY